MKNYRFYGLLAIMFVVVGAVRIFNGDLNVGLSVALLGLMVYLANGELWRRRFTVYIDVKVTKQENENENR